MHQLLGAVAQPFYFAVSSHYLVYRSFGEEVLFDCASNFQRVMKSEGRLSIKCIQFSIT